MLGPGEWVTMNTLTQVLRMLALNSCLIYLTSSASLMNCNHKNSWCVSLHNLYLASPELSNILQIMVDVQDSNEVIGWSSKPYAEKDGQGNHLIWVMASSVLGPPLSLSSVPTNLPFLMCNASALYSVLFLAVWTCSARVFHYWSNSPLSCQLLPRSRTADSLM